MINLSPLSIDRIFEIYAVANIPAYLFRKLRSEESVKAFADANTSEDLRRLVCETDRKQCRSPVDVAIAYAAVVALTYKSFKDMKVMEDTQFDNLRWVSHLVAIWNEMRTPLTEYSNLAIHARVARTEDLPQLSSTTFRDLQVASPKIEASRKSLLDASGQTILNIDLGNRK
jgi:hypothetical protein